MNGMRIVGGVAIGALACVGAVVLTPIAGAVGTVTLVGGLVSGCIGGAVGGACAEVTDPGNTLAEAEERGRQRGRNDIDAEQQQRFDTLTARYDALRAKGIEQERMDKLQLAVFAVGTASLNDYGTLTEENLQHMREIVFGTSYRELPKVMQSQVVMLEQAPRTLKTAFSRARTFGSDAAVLFDDIVEFARSTIDGDEAQRLATAWAQLRAA